MNEVPVEPRISRSNVAALIPAYRESATIRDTVQRTLAVLDKVLVIDDGSCDNTAAEARAGGAEVISHPCNQGKGAALKTGLQALEKQPLEYILMLDGDGQHLPEEIPAFLEIVNAGEVGMLVGSRLNALGEMPFVRRMTNWTMSRIISWLCGQHIPDSQCGFRMVQRSLVPSLFCKSDAFDYETEMLLIASRLQLKIASVPVSTIYGEEKSKIRPVRDTIRFFRLISRYVFKAQPGSVRASALQ